MSKTWPCIVEASHLLDMPRRYTMLRWVGAGALPVFPIDPVSLDDLVALMMQWPERPRTEMHLADASLLWLANDTGVARLMTLDGRDLSRCRLSDGRTSEIL